MKKLFEKKSVCILSSDFYKDVMETASLFTKYPYHTEHAQNAWYCKYLFWRRKGYLINGFKTNWPEKKESNKSDLLMPEVVEMMDTLQRIPIEMVFVPKKMYNKVKFMKSNGCIVEVTEYGLAKIKLPGNEKTTQFCLVASTFVKELSNEEIWKIKSIDGIVAGDEG